MKVDEKELEYNKVKIIGYVLMFFVFTTILYFILLFLDKLPKFGGYFSVILLTFILVFIGRSIKYWLSRS
tara:strand:+ start:976 stop:1185 length:210 start_codon:yes stop_codon:yes gene_type:complete